MKKVLSTVAALGLVAGLATTASAVEFKMSGHYMVEGAYLSDSDGAGVDTNETALAPNHSDAYFLHTFEMKPTMKVNDKISMSSVIRLADDTFWGSQTDGDINTSRGIGDSNGDVEVWQLWMDYASPIGKMKFGRTSAGGYGTAFMDYDGRANRVMLYPSFLADGPWSTLFYVQKSEDNNSVGVATTESDADNTTYVARVYYKNENLDSGLHYQFVNNQTVANVDDAKQGVTVYGKYKMDNYFANAELTHYFGSKDTDLGANLDYDSWAGMLQVGGKFDALTANLMYFYAQGEDDSSTDIEKAMGTTGTGDLFEPLYILTGRHTGMLNNDINPVTGTMTTAGVHAVVAAADYAVSNQLSLHGAIGWAKADETPTANTLQDDEYGWEYNVGAAYKLLDNLTYEAHFGYLDTGDFFNGNTTTDTTQNIYILTHSLTMTF